MDLKAVLRNLREERAGFPGGKVSATFALVSCSLMTITSQHWVFAHEGDHLTASKNVPNITSERGSGLYFRMLLRPLMASKASMVTTSALMSENYGKDPTRIYPHFSLYSNPF